MRIPASSSLRRICSNPVILIRDVGDLDTGEAGWRPVRLRMMINLISVLRSLRILVYKILFITALSNKSREPLTILEFNFR